MKLAKSVSTTSLVVVIGGEALLIDAAYELLGFLLHPGVDTRSISITILAWQADSEGGGAKVFAVRSVFVTLNTYMAMLESRRSAQQLAPDLSGEIR